MEQGSCCSLPSAPGSWLNSTQQVVKRQTARKPRTEIVENIGSLCVCVFMSRKHLFKLQLQLDNVFCHKHRELPLRLWHVIGRIWTNSAFWMFLSSMFIITVHRRYPGQSTNEWVLQIDFFSSLFWLRLHLKWSCLSFPDQRLYFVCVWYKFTVGQQRWLLSSRFCNPQIVFFSLFFFVFELTRREGNIEQKVSYCAEAEWQKFIYMANFLPDIFLFIHFSSVCNISGIMFFQPSFQNYYHRKSGVYFA